MADEGETLNPLDPYCFLQTFLNVKENSKGYNGASIRGERLRTVKALITPFRRGRFIDECSVLAPPNGAFGKRMFEFAWNNSSLFKTGNNQSQGNVYGYDCLESTLKYGTGVSQECTCSTLGTEKHFRSQHGTQQTNSDNLSSIFKHRGTVQEKICSNPLLHIGDCLQFEGKLLNNIDCEDDHIDEHVFDDDVESDICDISNDNIKDNKFATEYYVNDNKQKIGTTTSCFSVASWNLQDSDNDQMLCNASESQGYICNKVSGTEEGSFVHEETELIQREEDYVICDTTGVLHLDNLTSGGKNNHITHVMNGTENNMLDHVTNGAEDNSLDNVTNGAENNILDHVTNDAENNILDHVTNGAENNILDHVTNGAESNILDHVTNGAESTILDHVTNGAKNNILDHVTNGAEVSCFDKVTNDTKKIQLLAAVSSARINSLGHVTSGTEISDVIYGTSYFKDHDLDHMTTNSVENHDNGHDTSGTENHPLVATIGAKNHNLGHVTCGTENSVLQANPDEPRKGILQQQQKLFSSQSISTTQLADISVKFKISLLDSILIGPENQDNAISYDHELCGKLAVLLGFLSSSNPTVVQLTHTLSVGLFDFLDGTVRPYEQSEAITNQFLSTIKTRTLAQVMEELQISFRKHFTLSKHVPITNQNTRMSLNSVPVGWVITSPGLGVGLDRQLKEKLATVLEEPLVGTTVTQHESDGEKWQHLLMLLDEYRRCDDGSPLAEVYELNEGGKHHLVNFEIL